MMQQVLNKIDAISIEELDLLYVSQISVFHHRIITLL